jgi:2-C-methyl-D-erythritol 2,4-cyclodiphosphate synthase
MSNRVGTGIDFHELVEGRELWIGGIKIPHHKGALGHSDADVLLHAICDAMLGALALGDIGKHFPDTDKQYRNIDSKILLTKTNEMVKAKGYSLVNIDSTICLQLPKIAPYIDPMRLAIASVTGLAAENISVKATTTERMGFVGREEGIMATAVVLIEKTI